MNKNVRRNGSVELKSMHFSDKNERNISIIIKIGELEFELNLDEDWARYELESFKKESFLKLFDSEPTALAIYLSNQLQEFM